MDGSPAAGIVYGMYCSLCYSNVSFFIALLAAVTVAGAVCVCMSYTKVVQFLSIQYDLTLYYCSVLAVLRCAVDHKIWWSVCRFAVWPGNNGRHVPVFGAQHPRVAGNLSPECMRWDGTASCASLAAYRLSNDFYGNPRRTAQHRTVQ